MINNVKIDCFNLYHRGLKDTPPRPGSNTRADWLSLPFTSPGRDSTDADSNLRRPTNVYGRQNHLRDVVGCSVIFGTAILHPESVSLRVGPDWTVGSTVFEMWLGEFLAFHGGGKNSARRASPINQLGDALTLLDGTRPSGASTLGGRDLQCPQVRQNTAPVRPSSYLEASFTQKLRRLRCAFTVTSPPLLRPG